MSQTNKKTALIVEDSPTQALHLEHLLSENGMNTIWAQDSNEGLRCAQTRHPDVIIMDVFMPGRMNGLQLCKYLKEDRLTLDIPIIMLTQFDDMDTSRRVRSMGVVEYIPKDAFADAVLIATLREKDLIGKVAG